jgi:hypothetical protein
MRDLRERTGMSFKTRETRNVDIFCVLVLYVIELTAT